MIERDDCNDCFINVFSLSLFLIWCNYFVFGMEFIIKGFVWGMVL